MVAAVERAGAVAGDHRGRRAACRPSASSQRRARAVSRARRRSESLGARHSGRDGAAGATARRRSPRRSRWRARPGSRCSRRAASAACTADAPFDESADLAELARTPMIVVCAGAKSILDLPATWERLETPRHSGGWLPDRRAAGIFHGGDRDFARRARRQRGGDRRRISCASRARAAAVDCWSFSRRRRARVCHASEVEAAVATGPAEARASAESAGAAVTPFLLAAVTRLTEAVRWRANLALLEQNAALAAEIAVVVPSGDQADARRNLSD